MGFGPRHEVSKHNTVLKRGSGLKKKHRSESSGKLCGSEGGKNGNARGAKPWAVRPKEMAGAGAGAAARGAGAGGVDPGPGAATKEKPGRDAA